MDQFTFAAIVDDDQGIDKMVFQANEGEFIKLGNGKMIVDTLYDQGMINSQGQLENVAKYLFQSWGVEWIKIPQINTFTNPYGVTCEKCNKPVNVYFLEGHVIDYYDYYTDCSCGHIHFEDFDDEEDDITAEHGEDISDFSVYIVQCKNKEDKFKMFNMYYILVGAECHPEHEGEVFVNENINTITDNKFVSMALDNNAEKIINKEDNEYMFKNLEDAQTVYNWLIDKLEE